MRTRIIQDGSGPEPPTPADSPHPPRGEPVAPNDQTPGGNGYLQEADVASRWWSGRRVRPPCRAAYQRRARYLSCSPPAGSPGGGGVGQRLVWYVALAAARDGDLACTAAPAALSEGARAHVLLAEDQVAAVRARLASRRAPARRQARLRPCPATSRLRGAGARGPKNPKAKPLPIAKMMVHHFLYFAPGRVDQAPGGCWSGAGFIGGRGEEHPTGGPLHGIPRGVPRQVRDPNETPRREGPGLEPHRDGDEPLQEPEGLLRPHARLLHDREAHLGAAARDRQVLPRSPTACPTTCPAAARRARTSSDQSDWTSRRSTAGC